MFGDIEKIDEMKDKLNEVSPSFCLAKWQHCTIHLLTGHTHSCYLPPTHKIPLEEIEKDPSALHNTNYKKNIRKMMKNGQRPDECSICWGIEDLPDNRYSDRHYRGVDDWTMPFYEEIKNKKWDENATPTYVEVSWSSACNFKCMYCSPAISTEWMKEVRREGPYKLHNHQHNSLDWLMDVGQMPLDEDTNPYIDAFWKWWPDLIKNLMYFRLTGGEPLLSRHTFKTMELLSEQPVPRLELSINSNLGINEKQFNKFMVLMTDLLNNKKIRNHILHTSLDTWGEQAEYIRNGLKVQRLQDYTERYLSELPTAGYAFMSTFNNLSVVGYRKFLEYVLYLRKKFNNSHRQVLLDIPHLQGPEYFSAKILTPRYHEIMKEHLRFMDENKDEAVGFKKAEIQKMDRVLSWMQEYDDEHNLAIQRRNFYLFFKEHDRRRNTDFLKTFPEMQDFWDLCKKTFEENPVIDG